MSIKTFNNKFTLINSRIKYGTDGGINIDQNALVVNPLNGQVGINNLNPQYNLDVCGNTNVNGLINYYGNNINTQFYPALNPYSYAPKALSSWTITGSGNSPRDIVWSPELGVFAATSGNNVAYSFDGKTWKNRTTPSVSGLKTIVWSSELGIFCFAGNGSSLSSVTDAVVTSNIQGRPPTSYNTFDVSFNLISENGLWTYRSFGKGISVNKTTNFTISPGENSIIVNNSSGTTTATLPAASQWPGEEITIKTTQNQAVISASSNVVPINSAVPSNSIVTGTSGNWVTMVSDGTNWIVMKS